MMICKILRAIKSSLPLLRRPYLINSYVRRDSKGIQSCANWGDDLNGDFLSSIIDGRIYPYDASPIAYRCHFDNYLVIGSTIDLRNGLNQIIWGAGIIKENSVLKNKPKRICAVRGPKTRDVLLRQGISCPEVYGDPALLLPFYYRPGISKKYKWGIISHNSNETIAADLTLDGIKAKDRDDVLFISMGHYKDWRDIPDAVCSCGNIISSSLHGIIVAEAYNIPYVWVEFGNPLIGGRFKFYDFLESVHKKNVEPLLIDGNTLPHKEIDQVLSDWTKGDIDLRPLIGASPFKLKKAIYNFH